MAHSPKTQRPARPSKSAGLPGSSLATRSIQPMLVHYPSLPVADTQIQLRNGAQLREIIKTCADNGIPFRIVYDHGGKFRYHSDPCRTSR
jgi:hypothetical protein